MVQIKTINIDDILSVYEYDHESPSGFKRKFDWLCGKKTNRYIREVAGTYVDSKDQGGYYIIYLNGKHYLAHRVVALMFGIMLNPDDTIDHIDGNKNNNLPSNLRCVPRSINSRNRKMPNTNTSGVVGVSLNRMIVKGKEYLRWTAQWRDEFGKGRMKGFSVAKYGYQLAFEMACKWRFNMIKQRNEEGAAYSERHGETND